MLDIAIALRFQASIPPRFWGEDVVATLYTLNRFPITFFMANLYLRHCSIDLLYSVIFGCFYVFSMLHKSRKLTNLDLDMCQQDIWDTFLLRMAIFYTFLPLSPFLSVEILFLMSAVIKKEITTKRS